MSRKLDYAEMKQVMEQYFLLLNGKRPMKADLPMAGFKLKNWVQVLADAQYPNAYLLDGSRLITNNILLPTGISVVPITDVVNELGTTGKRFASIFTQALYMAIDDSAFIEWKAPDKTIRFVVDDMGIVGITPTEVYPYEGYPIDLGTVTEPFKDLCLSGVPKIGGVAGVDGSFTTADAKTVTVTKGIITNIA